MSLTFTILGSGCSYGVPYAGNDWGECDPHEPKNRRTRCSLLVQSENTTMIVDTGPDFREQMNSYDIKKIDGVVYTHKHPDHTAGIDDLRIYAIRNKEALRAYMDQDTSDYLMLSKDYLFKERHKTYPAIIRPEIIQHFDSFQIGDIDIETHVLDHVTVNTTGYRFGDLAYSVDMRDINNERSFEALKDIKTWIVDAGAYTLTSFSVHATFEHVQELNKRIKAERVILTSLSKRVDYKKASEHLPEGFELAYDGLKIKTQ